MSRVPVVLLALRLAGDAPARSLVPSTIRPAEPRAVTSLRAIERKGSLNNEGARRLVNASGVGFMKFPVWSFGDDRSVGEIVGQVLG